MKTPPKKCKWCDCPNGGHYGSCKKRDTATRAFMAMKESELRKDLPKDSETLIDIIKNWYADIAIRDNHQGEIMTPDMWELEELIRAYEKKKIGAIHFSGKQYVLKALGIE